MQICKQSIKDIIVHTFDERVFNNLDDEPFFGYFYSLLLSDDTIGGINHKNSDLQKLALEKFPSVFRISNGSTRLNDTKLNFYWRWYRYLGLGWNDPQGVFQPLPLERICRCLKSIFGKKKTLDSDTFIKTLSSKCPELDGGILFTKISANKERILSTGLSQALCCLNERKIIKLNKGIHEYNNKLIINVDFKKRNTKNTNIND